MARERRSRRRQARRILHAAIEGASTGPGACDTSCLGLSSRLGQEQESYLKEQLDRLSSFSVLQQGYTRNSAVVVNLLQNILDVVPGRPAASRASAQGLVQALPKPCPAWKESLVPKVLGSFARGTEGATFVRAAGPTNSDRPVPLSLLAEMDTSIHAEHFLRRLNECRELLPQVCRRGEAAEAAKQAVGKTFLEANFYAALMLISQPLRVGQTTMGKGPGTAPAYDALSLQEALFIWDALGIGAATHARMWRISQQTKADQAMIANELMTERARVLSMLAAHDAGSGSGYTELVDATGELLRLSQKLMTLHVSKQCELLYLLLPFQAGAIAAMQLPRTSLHNMLHSDRLPVNGPLELMDLIGGPAALSEQTG